MKGSDAVANLPAEKYPRRPLAPEMPSVKRTGRYTK